MKKVKLKYIVFVAISIVTVILGMTSELFLPKKFFNDAYVVALDRYNEIGLIGSFPFSMWFYAKTGLGALPFSLVALIQLPVLLWIIYKIGIPESFYKPTLRNVMVWLMLLMLAFYISMPSKEFITFIYVYLIYRVLTNYKINYYYALILSALLFVFFAYFFRPYFAFIPIISIAMYGLSFVKIKNRVLNSIFIGLLIAIAMSLSYGAVKGEFLSESTREDLNVRRVGSADANSAIVSPIATNTWYGESFGIAYGFATVNFPVNGLKHILKPQIVAFILWQLVLFGILFFYFSNCLKNRAYYKREIWFFYIVFSYFIIQGIFEPDLGSALRHKMGILPFIYVAMYYDKRLAFNKYIKTRN